MEISERLRQIVDYSGVSVNTFATRIGVSQPRIRNYLLGREPDYDILHRIIITFVNIDARWLLTGKGEMLVAKVSENTIAATQVSTQPNEIGNLSQAVSDVSRALAIANKTILLQQEYIAINCKSTNPNPAFIPDTDNLDLTSRTSGDKEK